MHIHKNIKYLRKLRGLTQQGLAQKINKTPITVGDYERGKVTPPLSIIIELCKIFNVDINTLVFHNIAVDGLPRPADNLQDKVTNLQQLNQLQQHRLAELEREIRAHAPELGRKLGLNSSSAPQAKKLDN